jgi:hypothetical protein
MSDRLVVIADAGHRLLLETMRAGGYYLAESLVDLAARQVGE